MPKAAKDPPKTIHQALDPLSSSLLCINNASPPPNFGLSVRVWVGVTVSCVPVAVIVSCVSCVSGVTVVVAVRVFSIVDLLIGVSVGVLVYVVILVCVDVGVDVLVSVGVVV